MNEGWALINGEQRHKETPDTFDMPPMAERVGLAPGKAVKIGVVSKVHTHKRFNAERFWVKILGHGRTLRYLGMVTNDLVFTERHGLKDGDQIEFGPEHVLCTEVPPPTARPPLLSRSEMQRILDRDPGDN